MHTAKYTSHTPLLIPIATQAQSCEPALGSAGGQATEPSQPWSLLQGANLPLSFPPSLIHSLIHAFIHSFIPLSINTSNIFTS